MEKSLVWDGITIGDASISPYDGDEWSDMYNTMFCPDRALYGIYSGSAFGSMFETLNIASPLSIGTGWALVDGKLYQNTAAYAMTVSTPAVSSRYDRLVLRKNFANQTVRLTLIAGVEAGGVPALVQIDADRWDIPLYTVYITTAGVITLSDERNFIEPANKKQINSNVIINGNFDVWQLGTSFAAIATAIFPVDRFKYLKVGAMVHTASQSTDVPTEAQSGIKSNYSLKLDCTTVDAAIAAGDYCAMRYVVEGYDYAPLKDNTITLSFWAKATKPGIYCIGFKNAGDDRSYVVEYTINTTATWEKKTITLTLNQAAGGTENYTNGIGLQIYFTLAGGTTFQIAPNSWQTGNYFSTANQVNGVDNTANDFYLAQVKLELGAGATEFVAPLITDEIEKCRRYFQKSYLMSVAVGSISSAGAQRKYSADTSYVYGDFVPISPSMRAAPTVTCYATNTGTAGTAFNANTGLAVTFIGLNISEHGTTFYSNTAGLTVGHNINWQYTLASEL